MKHNTCQEHKTSEQIEAEDHRSIEEKRLFFKIGNKIKANDEYRRIISKEPEFEGGIIIEFKDPYDFDEKTANSIANVEMPCGCTHVINTGWLVKFSTNNCSQEKLDSHKYILEKLDSADKHLENVEKIIRS